MATATATETKSSESLPSVGGPSKKATIKEQLSTSNNQLALLAKKLIDKTAEPRDLTDLAALLQSTPKLQAEHDKFKGEHKTRLSEAGLDPEDVFAPEAIKASYEKLFPAAPAPAPVAKTPTKAKGRPKSTGEKKEGTEEAEQKDLIVGYSFPDVEGKKVGWKIGKPFPQTPSKHFSALKTSLKDEAELKKALTALVVPDMQEFVKTPEGQEQIDLLSGYLYGRYKSLSKALKAKKEAAAESAGKK